MPLVRRSRDLDGSLSVCMRGPDLILYYQSPFSVVIIKVMIIVIVVLDTVVFF